MGAYYEDSVKVSFGSIRGLTDKRWAPLCKGRKGGCMLLSLYKYITVHKAIFNKSCVYH